MQVLEQARGQQVTNDNFDNLFAKGKDYFKQVPTLFGNKAVKKLTSSVSKVTCSMTPRYMSVGEPDY